MASKRLALVTGGNQGIGFSLCKKLAQYRGDTSTNSSTPITYHVLLAARNPERGQQAIKTLHSQFGLNNVGYLPLDVTDSGSIEAAVKHVKQQYSDAKLQVLINNAGLLAGKKEGEVTEEIARRTVDVNYYGSLHVTNGFSPSFDPQHTRVVHMTTSIALMVWDKLSASVKQRFTAANLTVEELNTLVETYVQVAKDGADAVTRAGFHPNAYGVSKIALQALCRIQARDEKRTGIVYNCAHPGFVDTQMTAHMKSPGKVEVDKGALTPLAAALVPDGGYSHSKNASENKASSTPSGMFWAREKVYRPC